MALKTWHKVTLSLITAGVTITSLYYGHKALKKYLASKKKAAQPPAKTTDAPNQTPGAPADSSAAPAPKEK